MNLGGDPITVCVALLIVTAAGLVAVADAAGASAGVDGNAEDSLAGTEASLDSGVNASTGSDGRAVGGADSSHSPAHTYTRGRAVTSPGKRVHSPPSDALSTSSKSADPFADAVPALEFHNLSVRTGTRSNLSVTNGDTVVVYGGSDGRTVPANASDSSDRRIEPRRATNELERSQESTGPSLGDTPVERSATSVRPTRNDGIVGADTRERVTASDGLTSFPWAPVVELRIRTQDGRRASCSGAIITEENATEDSYHVLTAGHCVYFHDRGGWIDIDGESASYVVPAANGDEEPFGRVGIEQIRSYDGWTRDRSAAYDIALLTLESRIGAQTGSLGYVGRDDPEGDLYTRNATRVTGYPGDKPAHTMWTSVGRGLGTTGPPASTSPEAVSHIYNADIYAGMSGGPVWVGEQDTLRVASVNAYAVDPDVDGETEYNQGARITNDRFDDLQEWMSVDDTDGTVNDRLEPNDRLAAATPLEGGGTIDGLRVVGGEFDLFAVELSAGESLTAETSFENDTGDLDLALYAANGTVLDSSTSITDGERVGVDTVSEGGTYYVGVYGYENASAPYSLSIAVESPAEIDVEAYATCTDVRDSEPFRCPSGTETDTFQPSDGRAISWLDFGTVDSSFPLTWRFYTPSGDRYATYETIGNEDAANVSAYRQWAWIDIAGTEAARMTGEWTVTVSAAGEPVVNDSFTIEDGEPDPVAEYANENGVVEADGLLDAAADFRAGAIDVQTLFDVAAAFRSGEPVT